MCYTVHHPVDKGAKEMEDTWYLVWRFLRGRLQIIGFQLYSYYGISSTVERFQHTQQLLGTSSVRSSYNLGMSFHTGTFEAMSDKLISL